MSEIWIEIQITGNRLCGFLRNGEWGSILRWTVFTLLDEDLGWRKEQ